MIRTVGFHNFKALRQVQVDLERFTVFVGPNASGKTSILEGLYFLTKPKPQNLHLPHLLPDDLPIIWTRGANAAIQFGMITTDFFFNVMFSPPGSQPLYRDDDSTHETLPNGWLGQYFFKENSSSAWKSWKSDSTAPSMASASLLQLDARQLARPSISYEAEPRIGSDGQGLATALAFLLLNRRMEFDRLLGYLRHVCPYVEGIRFNRALQGIDSHKAWGEELVLDLQGAPDIPARMVSDGTLLVLGLLAVMMGPDHPKLILLDDIDRGLHPRAQRDLVMLLRKLLEQDPALQIVATSHSPYLLDELEAEEVRMTTRREDGSVACSKLIEHPDFEKWKNEMRPGELWSLFGEKWVGERQAEAVGS